MRRGFCCFLTMLMVFLYSSIPALAQEEPEPPKPPALYSEAAILMDADTGQVLWGKNARKRMYPASLTKVVTCLLAMERGNMSDTVTITDEAVDTVGRYTTHIALTYGEQLTLEQLVYAMMVESANDAAHAVGIHLGGSLAGFAGMMNAKAAEIGATGSHFVNASGLPENDHYTTAYDLGLFTKAALAYPQFRKFAGTEHYEIPPTNLQPNTRRLNNRQYMFSQTDTYPGAFAGKTGWTEEAGKTLITIAQRDGVTLICVVLKAAGAVDAEFKDSTALLDYGFDHFKRAYIPKDRIPAQAMEGGSWEAGEDLPVLLPEGVSPDTLALSVEVSGDAAKAVVRLPESMSGQMETEYSYPLQFVEAVPVDVEPEKGPPWWEPYLPVALTVLKWAAIVIGSCFVLLLLLRQYLLYQYHKRKRRMREAAARRRASQLRQEDRAIDITVDKRRGNRIVIIDERER